LKFIFLAFIIISLFSCATAANRKNEAVKNTKNCERTNMEINTKITGRVQVYGNEPHTFVGIVDMNGIEYAVYPRSKEDELRQLQGHLIEFTVVFLDEPKAYGSLFLKGGTVKPIKWEITQ